MTGKGPSHRLVLASEKDANGKRTYIDVAALWLHGDKASAKLAAPYNDRPGIAAIKLTDGRVIDVSKYALFLNRVELKGTVTRAEPAAESWGDDDGEIPF